MNKILATLLVAGILCGASAFGDDKLRVSVENGKQRVDFSLNGNDNCVMIDDKIVCAPMVQGPIQVASSETN